MVKVDEPDDDTACLMLRGLKSRYADHHGVHITDDAVRAVVTLSRRYLTGRQLPDKAVDLLDTASARLRMSLDTVPEPLTRMKAQLTALAMEKQALLEDIALGNSARGDRLAAIEQEEIRLILALDTLETQYGQELQLTEALLACRRDISRQAEINDLQNALIAVQQGNPLLGLDVDVRTVATVIADWTGVPLSSLMKDEQTELLSLEESRQTGGWPGGGPERYCPAPARRENRPDAGERSAGCVPAGRAERHRQNGNGARPRRCAVRRRESADHHQSLRVPGAAHRQPAEGFSARLRRLRPGRDPDRGGAQTPLQRGAAR